MRKGYPPPPPPGVHPVGGPMPPPMAQGRGPPMSQYGRQPYGPQPGYNNGMPPPGELQSCCLTAGLRLNVQLRYRVWSSAPDGTIW
ncbi:hypothetical protein K450DRAFT_257192 [Umbelopsis ramanniana AG]|uniref:Uncharacterized protein n=1 Tax=Umbelopsis ramanniana AG TaxID=1314678 RepID=A0AAD5E4B9_UMBRA|nr:uncharacterized protein K450DRAFT_257192 [Umbelopsis ramanniana AG]KAI8576424.1 hypothetical protein K450DRAFT_257192 [Umbelopsis ramanniana AG]